MDRTPAIMARVDVADRKLEEEQRAFQVEDRAPFATHLVSVWAHSP